MLSTHWSAPSRNWQVRRVLEPEARNSEDICQYEGKGQARDMIYKKENQCQDRSLVTGTVTKRNLTWHCDRDQRDRVLQQGGNYSREEESQCEEHGEVLRS